MTLDDGRHLLHRFEPASSGPGIPSPQCLFELVPGLLFIYFLEGLFDVIRSDRLQIQMAQLQSLLKVLKLFLAHIDSIALEEVLRPFEQIVLAGLFFPYLSNRVVDEFRYVELVERYGRIRKVLAYALDERRGHVAGYVRYLFRIATVSEKVVLESFHHSTVLPLRHENRFRFNDIDDDGDVLVAAFHACLVHADHLQLGIILATAGLVDIGPENTPYLVVVLFHQTGHGVDRHLDAKLEHQRLEKHREPEPLAFPRSLDQPSLPVGKLDTGDAADEETLVLKKIQMPPALLLRVVDAQPGQDGAIGRNIVEFRPALEVYPNIQPPLAGVEFQGAYIPRFPKSQSLFE